ncbi:MAG: AAA family ATPase [Bacteroidetes bacterium]|nr:AAA family ATPase [Bacteroidota bacterium]
MDQRVITDDLEALLDALPHRISHPLEALEERHDLLEVVMDLGRVPEARFPGKEVVLDEREVTQDDLDHVIARIGEFGEDNRAGIARTLHRISAIRNRRGRVVGLTCRVGRAVFGTIRIIRDIVESGRSFLLLGRPGVGKTTMLREVARVLADEFNKRVIVVDTSNEIAGDGDIPHPGIGHARRMQVPTPSLQHAVMIEAVENHMPEVIVIDEIGTELEAAASRTIAERGVQLVATAHGNTLENLMLNPTLSDLVGGIQSVTLGDEEARRRGTQKSILERKAPPTFDVVVEIQNWERVAVHDNVAAVVDAILRGQPAPPEVRTLTAQGEVAVEEAPAPTPRAAEASSRLAARPPAVSKAVYAYGLSQSNLEQAIQEMQLPVKVTHDLQEAGAVLTLRTYHRKKPLPIRDAEALGIPVYVLKNGSVPQIGQGLASLYDLDVHPDPVAAAMEETQDAISRVLSQDDHVDLSPQNAYIRRLQHEMAERYHLTSRSRGREPYRHIRLSRGGS